MENWLKPGSKVICINDAPLHFVDLIARSGHIPNIFDSFDLRKDEIYTIESVIAHPALDVVCIRLVEVASRTPDKFGADFGYASTRFRPLISQETDVSRFESLLSPSLIDKLDLLAERMNDIASE